MNKRVLEKNVFDESICNIEKSKYAIVLGNYELQKYRVLKAVELYNNKIIDKIIFSGGNNGISNYEKNIISEAKLMKDLAIKYGVLDKDIIIENNSKDTIENIKNCYNLLKNEINELKNIIIITSEFHIKRSYLIAKNIFQNNIKINMVSAYDGLTDKTNWFNNDRGIYYITNENKYLNEIINKMKGI